MEPYLPPVTRSCNRPPPLDPSEFHLKSNFDVAESADLLRAVSVKLSTRKALGTLIILTCTRQDACNSQNSRCLPRCATACLVLTRFATIFVLFANKSIHGIPKARPGCTRMICIGISKETCVTSVFCLHGIAQVMHLLVCESTAANEQPKL